MEANDIKNNFIRLWLISSFSIPFYSLETLAIAKPRP